MRFLLAILLPPLAVLLCGKPIQFILNLFLTLMIWIPGIIHALFVVSSHKADVRNRKLIRAIKSTARQNVRQATPQVPSRGPYRAPPVQSMPMTAKRKKLGW